MKIRIVPYNKYSRAARLLAQTLTKKLGYKVRRGPPRPNRVNYMWGNPDSIAANKLSTFQAFKEHGVSCPEFTTEPVEAISWLDDGKAVIARKFLKASEGRGAVYVPPQNELPDAPLYVKYIPKKREYRIHVMEGTVILVQEKRKRAGTKPDGKIRNHGDWVFCTKNIVEPDDLREVALMAAEVADDGYGAVDIIYNAKKNKCYALEVNTAPGLCPTSAAVYADSIINLWGQHE